MIKLLLIGFAFFNSPSEKDSLGVETINGKMFVLHKVEEKETLYAISRRYGATVDAIKEYNTAAANGLEIGLILKVPYTPKSLPTTDQGQVHKVAPKETLFSISRQYAVSVDDLKQWNNLQDNALTVGQELIVRKKNSASNANTSAVTVRNTNVESQPISGGGGNGVHVVETKETMYAIARKYNITVDQLKQWNQLQDNDLKVGQALVVKDPKAQSGTTRNTSNAELPVVEVRKNDPVKVEERVTQPVAKNEPVTREIIKEEPKEQTIRISEAVKNGDEVVEAGVAELIDGTEGNRKYLALHRTAPVGTILKVRNEMNNREVFVRVIGKLPDTAYTDKVIIKISKSAYDRLGALDPKFRVEVTYYK